MTWTEDGWIPQLSSRNVRLWVLVQNYDNARQSFEMITHIICDISESIWNPAWYTGTFPFSKIVIASISVAVVQFHCCIYGWRCSRNFTSKKYWTSFKWNLLAATSTNIRIGHFFAIFFSAIVWYLIWHNLIKLDLYWNWRKIWQAHKLWVNIRYHFTLQL